MSQRVELYNFNHGQHRDLSTGKFLPLQPNKLGRPLTHEEMDYNMDYMEQTLAGYKIYGSNVDTTLSGNDVDKVLQLHRITPSDNINYTGEFTFDKYISKGFSNGDYVWIPSVGGDGTSGQYCPIEISVYSSGSSEFQRSTSTIFVEVTGAQGSVIILINGQVAQPSSINGNIYEFTGYSAGTYEIVAIDQAFSGDSCSATAILVIDEGVDPCLSFKMDSVTMTPSGYETVAGCDLDGLSLKGIDVASFGNNDGSIFVEVLGSIDYSQLVWVLNGTAVQPTLVSGNVFEITGVGAGTYTIYVYDVNNQDCDSILSGVVVSDGEDPCAGFEIREIVSTESGYTQELECDLELEADFATPSGYTSDCSSFVLANVPTTTASGTDT